ncbi:helix-turn-helix domain-containing protein [Chitinophaga sp. NPDC101104]|uniref:helix-turn-helix domain-containing protein n=1 Tax=Chitinophaga sp. NPDC101104 TaxID=3390561 RepID=UPI003D06FB67
MDEIRDEDFLASLGARIKELRRSAGMSDRDFANTAGISHSQVHRIETGQLDSRICTLRAIANTLGITVSELLKGL